MISSLFSFDKMVAVPVIKVVYWIGLIGGVIAGTLSAFGGIGMMRWDASTGLGMVLLAVVGTAFGLLMWRVMCEGMIVIFGIHDRLGQVREALTQQPSQ